MEEGPAHSHRHAVQFYQDGASLCSRVADFLAEGLSAGQAAVIIARSNHQEQVLEELTGRLINVEQARRLGDLVLLDAEDTLGACMVAGWPDADLFRRYIGTIFRQASRVRPGATIRAYGEMVDLLWKAGHPEAAIELEMLWNSLARTYDFTLLCGYSMGQFYKQPDLYARVCAEHDQVFADGSGREIPEN